MSDVSQSLPSWLKTEVAQDHLRLTPDITTMNEPEGNSLTAYLRERMADDLEPGFPAVVLDLTNVNLITSPAIGALIVIHRKMAARKWPFILVNLGPMLLETLEFLKLDEVLTICRTPQEIRQELEG